MTVSGEEEQHYRRTRIMGVLNITPDSFYGGSRVPDPQQAIDRASQMIAEGADILDIGGESTRPGSESISADEQIRRVLPVIRHLAGRVPVPLSIDTTLSAVAEACLTEGAAIINDISAAGDPNMLETIARRGASIVLMHMRGTPKTMQQHTDYADVVVDVKQFLADRAARAAAAGIRNIIVDPGIGFAKTTQHNLQLLARLEEIKNLGYPVLVGASRKSFLGVVSGGSPPEERLEASLAAAALAAWNGAGIIRTHDVASTRRALELADAVSAARYAE